MTNQPVEPTFSDDDAAPDALEKALALGLGLVATAVARRTAAAIWRAGTGRKPPHAESPHVRGSVVLLWGAAAGAAVGAARLFAQRQARQISQRRRSSS
ncbi:MAG TPA: hypothetical protein DCM51_06120 [Actinobacteria bacterium]|nr:hypothetical protein [Actinomycetota bacterium]